MNPVGTVTDIHSITYVLGMSWNIHHRPFHDHVRLNLQPSGKFTAGGMSLHHPPLHPVFADLEIVSISLGFKEWSFKKWPTRGSANHGGILRAWRRRPSSP